VYFIVFKTCKKSTFKNPDFVFNLSKTFWAKNYL
jgi:hypothetical protein